MTERRSCGGVSRRTFRDSQDLNAALTGGLVISQTKPISDRKNGYFSLRRGVAVRRKSGSEGRGDKPGEDTNWRREERILLIPARRMHTSRDALAKEVGVASLHLTLQKRGPDSRQPVLSASCLWAVFGVAEVRCGPSERGIEHGIYAVV